jgi:hypothetical protein
MDKVALGQVFSEYFVFPCQFSFHRLLHTHRLSSGAGTIGQLVADVPSGLSLTTLRIIKTLYCIHRKNKGSLSSDSDVDCYITIKKLKHYILSILPVFIPRWEIQTRLHRTLSSVRLPRLAEWTNFNCILSLVDAV